MLCLKKRVVLGTLHTHRFCLLAGTCCTEKEVGRNGLCLQGGESRNAEDLIKKYLKLFFL